MSAAVSEWARAPFPYFGGKRHAAPVVWERLGDVVHYVEPFFGSGAVLLARPHECNRRYYSETANDADGLLCNFWRAVAAQPEAVAEHASWPPSECDLSARHVWLVRWGREHLARLRGDPEFCDAKAAGWWVWGLSCWIGSGWCSGRGPWTADAEGRLVRSGAGEVASQRPHLGDDGRGVNSQTLREPGVDSQRPHLGDNGQGVNTAILREPGVSAHLPFLTGQGRGVNSQTMRLPGCGADEPHPLIMPRLVEWLRWLSARLRHVRIVCGGWERVVTHGATHSLGVDAEHPCGVFLDPPYSGAERTSDLYACDSGDVAAEVRAWCLEHGDEPTLRICLAGFADEGHEALEARGWTVVEWFKPGFLRGGMGNTAGSGVSQAHRDRLWFSPRCLVPRAPAAQLGLAFPGVER